MVEASIRGEKLLKSSRSGAGRSRECGGGEKGRRRKGGRGLPAGPVVVLVVLLVEHYRSGGRTRSVVAEMIVLEIGYRY